MFSSGLSSHLGVVFYTSRKPKVPKSACVSGRRKALLVDIHFLGFSTCFWSARCGPGTACDVDTEACEFHCRGSRRASRKGGPSSGAFALLNLSSSCLCPCWVVMPTHGSLPSTCPPGTRQVPGPQCTGPAQELVGGQGRQGGGAVGAEVQDSDSNEREETGLWPKGLGWAARGSPRDSCDRSTHRGPRASHTHSLTGCQWPLSRYVNRDE